MPIKDLQTRSRELGRIRLGSKNADRGFPQKLSKFRLTSPSKRLLDKAADLYGGEVREWTPSGGAAQWELYTASDRLPIIVPPQAVSQWYETWSGGGCIHRCDGETDYITGEACDPDSREHRESKPTTRLKVILRDVEGVGVWRLESKGWNTAVELPDVVAFLSTTGGYIEAFLGLEERVVKRIENGQPKTNRFMVPIIEIAVTPAELLAGQGRIVPAIGGGPVPAVAQEEHRALAAPESGAQTPPARALPTVDDIAGAPSLGVLSQMYEELQRAGAHTPETNAAGQKRYAELSAPPTWGDGDQADQADEQQPNPDGSYDAHVVEDQEEEAAMADMAWQRVLAAGGRLDPPMTLEQVTADFESRHNQHPGRASSQLLTAYARELEGAAG